MMRIAKIAEEDGGGTDSGRRSLVSADIGALIAAAGGSLRGRGAGAADTGRGGAATGFGCAATEELSAGSDGVRVEPVISVSTSAGFDLRRGIGGGALTGGTDPGAAGGDATSAEPLLATASAASGAA